AVLVDAVAGRALVGGRDRAHAVAPEQIVAAGLGAVLAGAHAAGGIGEAGRVAGAGRALGAGTVLVDLPVAVVVDEVVAGLLGAGRHGGQGVVAVVSAAGDGLLGGAGHGPGVGVDGSACSAAARPRAAP